MSPRIGSLCSGYGGLEMGVRAAIGGEVVWHAEIDAAARRVLAHRWPGVPNHGDVTVADWTSVEPVEVLTAGFPCQTVSFAGRRAGLLAVAGIDQPALVPTRSPWEGVVDAIRALRPRLVVIENVRGLLSAPVAAVGAGRTELEAGGAFGRVLGDLADSGLDAEWLCAGASDLAQAPHWRRRVFIVAAPADARGEELARWAGLRAGGEAQERRGRPDDGALAPADGWAHLRPAIDRWAEVLGRPAPRALVVGPTGGLVTNARFTEWLMGLPEGHVCDVPGVSEEAQRRLLGNGVVPQQAAAAVRSLLPLLLQEAA